ncbi:hypothetical protein CRUP_020783, partial [Coryphaenoides rupestris]
QLGLASRSVGQPVGGDSGSCRGNAVLLFPITMKESREDVRFPESREDVRFLKSREDVRFLKSREDGRFLKSREDVRFFKSWWNVRLVRTVFTLTLTFCTFSIILFTLLDVMPWLLDSLVSSPWMPVTERSISCCRASRPLWVCWIWSTAPMILSSRVSTITPFTGVSNFRASSPRAIAAAAPSSTAVFSAADSITAATFPAATSSSSSSEGVRLTSSSEISRPVSGEAERGCCYHMGAGILWKQLVEA